jgi:phenylalanyl-tRNA synthetase beta chain
MLFSYNWLKEYVPKLPDPKTIAHELTTHAVEVEEVRSTGNFDNIVIGKIESVDPHPIADRLRVCQVSTGDENFRVVCGGSNLAVNQLIVLAKVGSRVRWHGEGDLIELKPATIRGVESQGMICASVELGLQEKFPAKDDHEIMDVTGASGAKPGMGLDALLGGSDTMIDIDNKSMTHRPDLFSHRGMAREMAAVFNVDLQLPTEKALHHTTKNLHVELQDSAACRRYVGIEMNVTVGQSPDFIRQRLESCGIKSINNVVDITNYILLEYGQPVHAFDADKIDGNLVVRRAQKGESIATLDHLTHKLDENILVIADNTQPLAIAGIIGGTMSAVSNETKRIILEVAHFDAFVTRKASQHVGVRTDGTLRWEKGPSEDMPTYSAPRAVELLQQHADGEVVSTIDLYPKKHKRESVKLTASALQRLAGIEIPKKEVVALLERLECEVQVSSGKDTTYTVTPPWFRMDLHIPEDIIEEVIRLYGINRIPEQPLVATLRTPVREPELVTIAAARNALANMGCTEIYNYSFYGQQLIDAVGLQADKEHIEILNPLSDDLTHLRVSVLPRMLETVARNQRHSTDLAFFEVGHTYFADREVRQLGIMIMDKQNAYRRVRGIVESLLQQFRLPHTTTAITKTAECEFWGMYEDGHALRIDVHGAIAGTMGEASATVTQKLGIDTPVAFAVLSIPVLTTAQRNTMRLEPLPEFPSIPLDLSLVVDAQATWGDIETIVRKHAETLLANLNVLDVYTGKGIPEGKKSIAFRMIMQAPDRTLEMGDMEKLREKIVAEANKRLGAILRE